jgi:TRAP-type mannitol/chloroaromatic compound transport system permease small subunit
MTAYWFLGGAYTILLRGHVRMDLLYSNWNPKRQGMTDVITDFCLIFYLFVLLVGGINSAMYALEYHQVKRSIWAPPMAPIKIIMCAGIILMLLQSFSTLFKDWAKAKGETI